MLPALAPGCESPTGPSAPRPPAIELSVSTDRVRIVEEKLDQALESASAPPRRLGPEEPLSPGSGLTARTAFALFEDQVLSRALDVAARELKKSGKSYYTISSAGHEQNAVVGAQLRLTDPCFLHYRSGGLMMARSRRLPGSQPLFDSLLSLCASAEDPISGGRHKVWGSKDLWVPPQTSTIASHVPKAVGAAFALTRARRLGIDPGLPKDTIVCCSLGDASVNHATALSGFNSARYARRHGNPTPVLFVVEDNGRGISVPTPQRWISDLFEPMTWIEYREARGTLEEIWDTTAEAIETCRRDRVPVVLHLHTVRLWGHAGSDLETGYRSLEQIEEVEAKDPLLANALRLIECGVAEGAELLDILRTTRERVAAVSAEVVQRPRLESAGAVMAPLAPFDEEATRQAGEGPLDADTRRACFGTRLPEEQSAPPRRTLAAHLNSALHDLMLRHRELLVFGEDVGRKGGVYGLTANLQRRFGAARVFDTLLDETTILGVAQGAAQMGFLPIPEIQYLAYIHNALDQIRGEACSLSFFSNAQFQNPMVVRIAGLAYQKGFGGHFHNDNSIGALRDIPGLRIAVPSRGDEAAKLLRGAVATAQANGSVVAFLEPIALYHEKDLFEPDDHAWLSDYPTPGEILLPGEVGVHGAKDPDLCIATYANGVRMSLRAARTLERDHDIAVSVVDLRWLNPLPVDAVEREATRAGRLLVVDECRSTGGGIAEALVASLAERKLGIPLASVRAHDSFVPLGPAADTVLIDEHDIVDAARKACR